jgi:hypothetical protein
MNSDRNFVVAASCLFSQNKYTHEKGYFPVARIYHLNMCHPFTKRHLTDHRKIFPTWRLVISQNLETSPALRRILHKLGWESVKSHLFLQFFFENVNKNLLRKKNKLRQLRRWYRQLYPKPRAF